jgi:solute:Na+ symporter, SSS family
VNALIVIVALYLAVTIGIGLYAARRVTDAKDYMIAGRGLPLYMNTATVFATWFGAETVLSVSATFTKDGLNGIPGDPFGASMCLILVAFFFARTFYKMNLLTVGDYYRIRYNDKIELLTSFAIVVSYLGWTSAQLTALGLVFSVLSGGAMPLNTCILLGAVIVLFYTIWGGMWSVALTDLFQTVVILVGLVIVAYLVGGMAGGADKVIAAAAAADKFSFWPTGGLKEWLAFIAAFVTVALGSIPQQDVFQRVTSAKDEKTAVRGTLIGAVVYFFFAFVPMFIAFSALLIDPSMAKLFSSADARDVQRILPDLILNKTPLWAQALFFGALLSAILSTASGALLAPTSLFAGNVLKPFLKDRSDKQFMLILRVVLVCFTAAALLFALNSEKTMYEMVQNAYKVTLVGAFVPLAAGIYWRRANSLGATLSFLLGLGSWLSAEYLATPETVIPPQLIGLGFAALGMLIGGYAQARK